MKYRLYKGVIYMGQKEFSYIIELDYGYRMKEIEFIKDILNKYNNNDLIGANIFIGNNIYYPEFYLHLNFSEVQQDFEEWIRRFYPDKIRKFNFFLGDIFNAMGNKSFNSMGLMDSDMLEFIITPYPNGLFLSYDKPTYDKVFPPGIINEQKGRVFICHVSEDKSKVIDLFNTLQGKEIDAFIDKNGIKYGEDIEYSISQNLRNAKLALVCYSKNFLKKKSNWVNEEIMYFKNNNINIIPINLDLNVEEMRGIIGNRRYYGLMQNENISDLIKQIKTEVNGRK